MSYQTATLFNYFPAAGGERRSRKAHITCVLDAAMVSEGTHARDLSVRPIMSSMGGPD
jgi:hypothetical protein